MHFAANLAQLGVAGLLLLKTWAYVVEAVWLFRFGTSTLLPAYQADPVRTYEKDFALNPPRPRPFTRSFDVGDLSWPKRIVGVFTKTPTLVVGSAVLSLALAKWCTPWVCITFAACLGALVLLSLLTALTMRLVMGPFDALNPDLRVGRGIRTRLYSDGHSLGLYLLALILITIAGFSAIYANLSHAHPHDFQGGASSDPIRWIYFTITVASTVGFGDIYAKSDIARTFVVLQMGAGSLLIAWALSIFFGQTLPEDIQRVVDSADRDV